MSTILGIKLLNNTVIYINTSSISQNHRMQHRYKAKFINCCNTGHTTQIMSSVYVRYFLLMEDCIRNKTVNSSI